MSTPAAALNDGTGFAAPRVANSHKRWGRAVEPISFAVALRIEDVGATVPIYAEVANAIDVIVESRAETMI